MSSTELPIESWVVPLKLPQPSLSDNTADVDRLIDSLKKRLGSEPIFIDPLVAAHLPRLLRENDFSVQAVVFFYNGSWHVTGAVPIRPSFVCAGVALDIGTTGLVVRLVDLKEKRILGEADTINPQVRFGADVLSRIHFAEKEKEGSRILKEAVLNEINRVIESLCSGLGISPSNIFLAAIAGNTAMTHLFLGLPPQSIIREPYIPVVNMPLFFPAQRAGLLAAPFAGVYIFPSTGSYFGGDLIAGILASQIHKKDGISLLVDIGTNAEVVLGNREWLVACAGAAGPALEGGVTSIGMPAGPGAIERVKIDGKSFKIDYSTIGNVPAVGICGSGMIDLAAWMFLSGLVDIKGRFRPEKAPHLFKESGDMPWFVLEKAQNCAAETDIAISQADFDSLVRSKAAMYTILETITRQVGLDFSDIESFFMAGTFGLYIDPESAVAIGMIPDVERKRFSALGNTSIAGTTRLLSDPDSAKEVEKIRRMVTYMELNVNQEFMNRFSAARFLPHTEAEKFPSVIARIGRTHSA